MPAPSWVRDRIEAIAVRDVLHYLVAAASLDGPINRTFDIGCRQVLTYAAMMKEYAAEAGLPTGWCWPAGPAVHGIPLVQSLQDNAASDPLPSDPDWSGHTVYIDERTFHGDVDPEHVWTIVEGFGGRNGWYSLPLAWQVRGWLDKLTGGAGLLRGRRHPKMLAAGEVVDSLIFPAMARNITGAAQKIIDAERPAGTP